MRWSERGRREDAAKKGTQMQPETTQPAETGRDTGNGTAKPEIPGGRLLTTSRLKTEHRCSREQRIKYELGYQPLKDDEGPARLGTLVHLGLEAWWRWHQCPDEGTPLAAAILALPEDADPYERAKARAMLLGYDARWREDADRYEVLGVELEFTPAPILNPATGRASRTWLLGGKLDAKVREIATGRMLVVEHKTTSEDISAGSDYFKRLKMDSQVSVYTTTTEAVAVLYDVLAKPGQRPSKATPLEAQKRTKDGRLYANQREVDETPDEYFVRLVDAIAESPDRYYARAEVVRFDGEIREHMADVWATAARIRENQIVGAWPRNPEACVRFGRTCPYFAVCCGEASLEDGSLFVRVENAHRELSQPETRTAA